MSIDGIDVLHIIKRVLWISGCGTTDASLVIAGLIVTELQDAGYVITKEQEQ